MIISILMIIVGVWLSRWAKRFEAQRRQEIFDQWALQKKITDDALRTIDSHRKENVQILQAMSDRINYVEERKESVLNDFKEMLNLK